MRAHHLAAAFVMTTALVACKTSSGGGQTPQPDRPRDDSGVPLDLRADEVTVDEDGKCWWVPEVSCPEDSEMSCNPPAPMEVTCPAGAAKPGADAQPDDAQPEADKPDTP